VFFFYQAFTFSNSNPSLPRPPPWYYPNPPTCVRAYQKQLRLSYAVFCSLNLSHSMA